MQGSSPSFGCSGRASALRKDTDFALEKTCLLLQSGVVVVVVVAYYLCRTDT